MSIQDNTMLYEYTSIPILLLLSQNFLFVWQLGADATFACRVVEYCRTHWLRRRRASSNGLMRPTGFRDVRGGRGGWGR